MMIRLPLILATLLFVCGQASAGMHFFNITFSSIGLFSDDIGFTIDETGGNGVFPVIGGDPATVIDPAGPDTYTLTTVFTTVAGKQRYRFAGPSSVLSILMDVPGQGMNSPLVAFAPDPATGTSEFVGSGMKHDLMATSVPEPSAFAFGAIGCVAVGMGRWVRRRNKK